MCLPRRLISTHDGQTPRVKPREAEILHGATSRVRGRLVAVCRLVNLRVNPGRLGAVSQEASDGVRGLMEIGAMVSRSVVRLLTHQCNADVGGRQMDLQMQSGTMPRPQARRVGADSQ